ncbi:hypothetical protein VQZ34_004433 [Salmonella enterica]|nr:hypothetical protein [Salmonella enterica]
MCGLIYELYQQRFSVEIDSVIDALPIAERELRILAQREHPFRRNVNAISGFA